MLYWSGAVLGMKMFDRRFFIFLCCANVVFSVCILGVLYVNRFTLLELHWTFWFLAAYGFVVTPFLIFRLISAYLYKPLPDRNYRPKVSVIVPCYNDAKGIFDTIDSILKSDYPKDLLELVVVDDASVDGSWDAIQSHKGVFTAIKLPRNVGKRHAMSAGIKQAKGDIFVCVDSDTIVKVDAIKNIVQPLVDKRVYCVCGNAEVLNGGGSVLARFQKVWYNESFRIRKGVESLFGVVFCCSGVLAAYRADKLKEVLPDFLGERFLGVEVRSGDDRRLTNLMLKLGGRSVFQSSAVAYTVAPNTVRRFVKQQVRWGRGSLRGMLFALTFFHNRSFRQGVAVLFDGLCDFYVSVCVGT
ncbi:MAG: glycosyltransferase family 2 protein [Candidatus Bathyarchaeota archaeon]|nr:glycosyltransferase family 2 protein [Candidatus Termiticorpusculum sp.]